MKRQRRLATFSTLALVAVVACTASCSDKSTNPNPQTVARELNSGNIVGGGNFSHTFPMTAPANYNYHCALHSGMSGSVHVEAGHPATATVTISDFQFSPATALVAPGGTVTWNNGGSTHTVTSD